ncbi:MAG: hypothetical protein WCO06_06525 [Candidatus Roizmanbacteria bacterium]
MIQQLSQKDLHQNLMARNIAELYYKSDYTSIGTILSTNSWKTFTGIILKYHVHNSSMYAERPVICKELEDNENVKEIKASVKYIPSNDTFEIVTVCRKYHQTETCHKNQYFCQKFILSVDIEVLLPYLFS